MLKSRLLIGLVVLVSLAAACAKSDVYDKDAQYQIDEARILKWRDFTKISLTKHSSGLYYNIERVGAGTEIVGEEDELTVLYSLRILPKDTVIDSRTDEASGYKFILKNSIEGWRNGLPLIREGGKIRLIIPSNQAYLNHQVGNIPPNSVLDFTIDLRKLEKKK